MRDTIKRILKSLIPVNARSSFQCRYPKVYWFGLRYKCPFCNSHLRTLLPSGCDFAVLKEKEVVGGGKRDNVLCPICRSRDRERLLYLYLLNKTQVFKKPIQLLHVAPEARLAKVLRPKMPSGYLTADISPEDGMIQMDITDIQFPDCFFDAIICNHVLEHIIDDRRAISELYRTLKPGGWAILQVPISLTLKGTYEDFTITTRKGREDAFGQWDHVRIYALDYPNRLANAGFVVSPFKWIGESDYFGGRRNVFALNEKEWVHFVRKPQ